MFLHCSKSFDVWFCQKLLPAVITPANENNKSLYFSFENFLRHHDRKLWPNLQIMKGTKHETLIVFQIKKYEKSYVKSFTENCRILVRSLKMWFFTWNSGTFRRNLLTWASLRIYVVYNGSGSEFDYISIMIIRSNILDTT